MNMNLEQKLYKINDNNENKIQLHHLGYISVGVRGTGRGYKLHDVQSIHVRECLIDTRPFSKFLMETLLLVFLIAFNS